MMVEDSVRTKLIEMPPRAGQHDHRPRQRPLVAVALDRRAADGLSMVYSFYDPDARSRSLGTFLILDHIERAKKLGYSYVYLGYWVEGARKMDYKGRFRPQERLMPDGWTRVDD
jgi:arginine-tRNA-protein transferase